MRTSIRTRLTVIIVSLAVLPLLLVGIVSGYLGYTSQRQQALDLERAVAQRVSGQVGAFIQELESTARYTVQPWRLKDLDQSQQAQTLHDFVSNQDALDALILVDGNGRERIHVSRDRVTPWTELGDRSASDEFVIPTTTGETYFGPVWYGGGTTNEPLMTIAVPIREPGATQVTGVLIANARVRRIWNLLATIKLSGAEIVYVVDAQGNLVAHPDHALVRQGVRFVPPSEDGIYTSLNKTNVVLAVDRLQFGQQEFYVIAERPVVEALTPAFTSLGVILGVIAVTLVVAASVGLVAVGRIIRPIQAVAAAAYEISAGNLSKQVQVTSQDEIGGLARAFNDMTTQLRKTLERVAERTAELREATGDLVTRSGELEKLNLDLRNTSQQAERRATQLAASAQVAHAASQVRDLDQLLPQVTHLISQAFGYYHVGVFIVDEAGRFAVLRAANSEGGQRMLARGHKLAVGKEGIVGYVTGTGQPRTALDVGADAVHFDNPDLPQSRSEMALPLSVGGQTFGALDVQSTQEAAFTEEDVAVLSTLADQIAIAIENARLFTRTQAALQEAEEIQRRYQRQEWEKLLAVLQTASHEYRASGVPSVGDAPLPEIEEAIRQGRAVTRVGEGGLSARAALAMPIKLRDQLIGVIDLQETDAERQWTDDDVALVTAVADQVALALENVRLFEQTRQRAQREQLISQVTAKMRAAPDIEAILRTTVREVRRALGASQGVVRLRASAAESAPGADQATSRTGKNLAIRQVTGGKNE